MVHSASQPFAQVVLLQGHLQHCLDQRHPNQFEVLIGRTLSIQDGLLLSASDMPANKVRTPAIAVVEVSLSQPSPYRPTVRWVIDTVEGDATGSCLASSQALSHFYARLGVMDCWILSLPQIELRAYSVLSSRTWSKTASPLSGAVEASIDEAAGYRRTRLYSVGEQASPTSISDMMLRVQEPLPLYFLTRTATGQRTHITNALPLQVCSDDL